MTYAIGLRRCDHCGQEQISVCPVAIELAQCGLCEQMGARMVGTSHALAHWPELVADMGIRNAMDELAQRCEAPKWQN